MGRGGRYKEVQREREREREKQRKQRGLNGIEGLVEDEFKFRPEIVLIVGKNPKMFAGDGKNCSKFRNYKCRPHLFICFVREIKS